MSRTPAATDFFVTVEGIGTFSFAQRKLRDELRIAAEYSRITEGVENPTPWLALVGGWIAAISVLAVTVPHGWDIEEMDPLDQDTYDKLRRVHEELRKKEQSFRSAKGGAGASKRQDHSEGPGVLVPQEVQPGTD